MSRFKSMRGFTLVELVAVILLVSLLSVSLFSRIGNIGSANIQSARDDVITALFFAQQTAMARSGIQLVMTANSVSVTENSTPIVVSKGYPLSLPSGVTSNAITFTYDKLGRTTAGTITLTGTSTSATISVETTGYAH